MSVLNDGKVDRKGRFWVGTCCLAPPACGYRHEPPTREDELAAQGAGGEAPAAVMAGVAPGRALAAHVPAITGCLPGDPLPPAGR